MPDPLVITGELLHTAPAKGGDITFQVGPGLTPPETTFHFEIGGNDEATIEAMRLEPTGEVFVWGRLITTDISLTSTFVHWLSTVLRLQPTNYLRLRSGNGYLGGSPGEIVFKLSKDHEVLRLQANSAVVLGEPTTDARLVVDAVRRFLVGVLSQSLRDTEAVRETKVMFADSLKPTVWDRLNEE